MQKERQTHKEEDAERETDTLGERWRKRDRHIWRDAERATDMSREAERTKESEGNIN